MYADPVRRYFKNFDSPQFNAVPFGMVVSREVVHSHYYLCEENGEPREYFEDVPSVF